MKVVEPIFTKHHRIKRRYSTLNGDSVIPNVYVNVSKPKSLVTKFKYLTATTNPNYIKNTSKADKFAEFLLTFSSESLTSGLLNKF